MTAWRLISAQPHGWRAFRRYDLPDALMILGLVAIAAWVVVLGARLFWSKSWAHSHNCPHKYALTQAISRSRIQGVGSGIMVGRATITAK